MRSGSSRWTRLVSLGPLNAKATYPQQVAAEARIAFSDGFIGTASPVTGMSGVFDSVEPGLRCAKAHLGYMALDSVLVLGFLGWRADASHFRPYSWDHDENGRDYLGASVSGNLWLVVASVSAYRDWVDHADLVSVGINIGLQGAGGGGRPWLGALRWRRLRRT